MTEERDGYGRCVQCGGPFGPDEGEEHISSCRYRREWRPLLMGEYPPPGPTRIGRMFVQGGCYVAPVYVYAMRGASDV